MPTATAGSAIIEIDAPPLHVYEMVSDITRMGEWSPECYRCEWLDGATTCVAGARFRGHNRLGAYRWQTTAVVTVADPVREFAFTILHDNGREETLWSYRFSSLGAGTEVVESYEFLWCPITNRIAELPIPRDKTTPPRSSGNPAANQIGRRKPATTEHRSRLAGLPRPLAEPDGRILAHRLRNQEHHRRRLAVFEGAHNDLHAVLAFRRRHRTPIPSADSARHDRAAPAARCADVEEADPSRRVDGGAIELPVLW